MTNDMCPMCWTSHKGQNGIESDLWHLKKEGQHLGGGGGGGSR
jgi:hypothetical protein